ncbi:MAG TPA: hypothetical protein VFV43_09235 [Limnobacter sp.]|nr:hypothetical protein [Limnobacter sp.]
MTEIDTLAAKLAAAKEAEDAAKAIRIQAEQALIDLLGCLDEGAKTHKGEAWKVTITGKVNRTLDVACWEAIKTYIPEAFRPVKYKPEIDVTGLKWLKDNQPGVYATVCQAISAKPGKPSVTFSEIK